MGLVENDKKIHKNLINSTSIIENDQKLESESLKIQLEDQQLINQFEQALQHIGEMTDSISSNEESQAVKKTDQKKSSLPNNVKADDVQASIRLFEMKMKLKEQKNTEKVEQLRMKIVYRETNDADTESNIQYKNKNYHIPKNSVRQSPGGEIKIIENMVDSDEYDAEASKDHLKDEESIKIKDIEEITSAMLDAIIYEMILDPQIKHKLQPQLSILLNNWMKSQSDPNKSFSQTQLYESYQEMAENQYPENIKKTKNVIVNFSDAEIISNYLDCLFTAVYSQSSLKEGIYDRINTPIGPTNLQKIKLLSPKLPPFSSKITINGQNISENLEYVQEQSGFQYQPVLPINLYIQMEEILKLSVYLEEELDAKSIENRHILHKMIYDCLNELLDDKRIYGLNGKGFEFLKKFKIQEKTDQECIFGKAHLELTDFSQRIVDYSKGGILQELRDKLERFSKVRAGVLKEKVDREGWEELGVQGIDVVDVIRQEVVKGLVEEFVSLFIRSKELF